MFCMRKKQTYLGERIHFGHTETLTTDRDSIKTKKGVLMIHQFTLRLVERNEENRIWKGFEHKGMCEGMPLQGM